MSLGYDMRSGPRWTFMTATFACLLAVNGAAVAGNTTWDRNARWLEEQITHCASGDDEDACRYFPARALARLFGLAEFCSGGDCMNAAEIAAKVAAGGEWSLLGPATDQKILTQAQDMAVGGLAVIAVRVWGDMGLVAIVMPGKLFPSQTWKHEVPISTGARVDKPSASVYGKGLNFLFADPTKVTLYVHK
jgi:hypothetical protein